MDNQSTQSRNFDVTSFARAKDKMVATNDSAYNGRGDTWRSRLQRIRDYTPEEIAHIIQDGSLVEQQKLSRNYFYKDGYYKQILLYYATLLKYVGVLIPNPANGKSLSTSHIQKRYYNAVDYVEAMNIPVWLTNCAIRALVDGSYYGVRLDGDKNSFGVVDLPAQYCCSRFKDATGADLIEFDLTYFNTISNLEDRQAALNAYPKVISKEYKRFCEGKRTSKWYIIPSDIGICFPLFDGRPLFLNVIPKTLEYDDAIADEQEALKEGIDKIIVQQIPHLTDGRLVFEPDEAEEIHAGTVGMLKGNKHISVLTTYANVSSISSNTNTESVDNILSKYEQNIYAQAGVSGQIFASTGTGALNTSLTNSMSLMMYLANKFAFFITHLINHLFSNSNISFKYVILPVSYFNTEDYMEQVFKLVGYGYSFLLPSVALGITQKDLGNLKDLENNVLKLGDKLKPLQTAYTQSNKQSSKDEDKDEDTQETTASNIPNPIVDEGGRPTKKTSEKSERTLQDDEANDKAGGS